MKAYTPALIVAILLFLPSPSVAQGVKVLNSPTIPINQATGMGSALLYLKNDSQTEAEVYLTANLAKASEARFSFGPAKDTEGKPAHHEKIAAGAIKEIWIVAHDVWEAGDLEAELKNNGTLLQKIHLKRFPLGVKFDSATPDKAEFSLINGQSLSFRLKNEDATLYPLTWKLWINGTEVCTGDLKLPPTGVGLLQCKPTVNWHISRVKDLFKPDNTEGHALALYPNPIGEANSTPIKTLPVAASMSYFQPFTQQIWGYIIIVLVLILGGLTSLFLSQALPNRLQRLKIEEQIDDLARSTADLSSHVESKLHVVLRLERSQIRNLLRSRKTWSPDFLGIVNLCTQTLDRLASRVRLAQQMDVVLRRLASMLPRGIPPQQVDEVEGHVRAAGVLIAKTAPTDADLQAAQVNITKASDLVERMNQPDSTFGQQLAQRALKMKDEIDANLRTKSPAFDRIIQVLPGPDNTLKTIAATTTEIPAGSYVEVDVAVAKMSVIRDYALLVDNTKDTDASGRLRDHEDDLIAFLQTSNWHDLRDARLLLRQMKDDVYADRIGNQLHNDHAEIQIDPRVAYHGAPLELCIHFRNASLNSAAAREEWKCTWNFGDGLEETGWTVSHYFLFPPPPGPRFLNRLLRRADVRNYPVEARFQHHRTGQSETSEGQPIVINRELQVRARAESGVVKGRTWTEGLRLAAALLIAVFGLVAGAREQLTRLDILPGLIAVFLVGFGADTIKNLLTPKP